MSARIVYPIPAPDLASRMADALASLSDDDLRKARRRLDQYSIFLTPNDILALRGATFRSHDASARKMETERRVS